MFLSPDKLSGITCLSSLLPSMSRPSPLLNSSQTARPPPHAPRGKLTGSEVILLLLPLRPTHLELGIQQGQNKC